STQQQITCILRNNTSSTTLVSTMVPVQSINTAGVQVASAAFTADGTSTYSIRFSYGPVGSRHVTADKGDYQLSGMNAPQLLDLGQGGRIWLADYSATAIPSAFYWDATNQKWASAAAFGPSGAKAIATDASDSYQYILADDKKVYRLTTASVATYTSAITQTGAGLCVAANRLFVLGEDTTNGSELWEFTLDATAGLPLAGTSRGKVRTQGVTADTTLPRRMAAMANGVVFFVNDSLRSTVYTWDAGGLTLTPFQVLPEGFQSRALCHTLGTTFVAGQFPAADQTGTSKPRPAVFQIDHLSADTGAPAQLSVKLWRDDDADGVVQDIQCYGTDVFVLTQVDSAPKKMRLWRISLATPGGYFLEHEITTDDTQQSASARSFALHYLMRAMAWGAGSPYVSGTDYITSGEAYLESSIFDNGLREPKLLLALAVDGDFPTGTSADIQYQLDQSGTYLTAGHVTQEDRILLANSEGTPTYKNLQLRVYPHSSLVSATPAIRSLEAQSILIKYARTWELFLDLTNATAANHPDGWQSTGFDQLVYLDDLASSGQPVELEVFGLSGDPSNSSTDLVTLRDPEPIMVRTGEFLVRLTCEVQS
ncbi:MAG TPA: hypothetical protein VGR13_07055, partial [Actinomycetota bacterium]|nr:hypothetical protein [Actinomycetota bacterium]